METPSLARRGLVRLVMEHNPFYLLSAACMLGGCMALTNSLSMSPIELGQLLVLIATLGVYELLLVGLGIFLIRRGQYRDGLILFLLEAVFLVDAAFLNVEILAADLEIGLIVNAALLLLAVVKLYLMLQSVRVPLRPATVFYLTAQLALLYAVPITFASLADQHDGALPAAAIYAVWWAAGLLPVLLVGIGRWTHFAEYASAAPTQRKVQQVLVRTLLVLPLASLLVHLCLANWIYDVLFYPGNVAPFLLGLGVAAGRIDRFVPAYNARTIAQFVLPALAVGVSWTFPAELAFSGGELDLSPLRLILLGTAAVYVDGYVTFRHAAFLWLAGTCLGASMFGSSPQAILANGTEWATSMRGHFRRIVPRTSQQWGVIAVAAAFVLMAVGAIVSVLRGPRPYRPRIVEDMSA